MEKKNSKIERQKRYGQFFSGQKVAELLVSLLPEWNHIGSVIDPMAGTGDMLSAVQGRKEKLERLVGIEIDNTIIEECKRKVPDAEIICGDAFLCSDAYGQNGWDLVITNPPYVRYQLQKVKNDVMPSREQIRKGLIDCIPSLCSLEDEKEMYLKAAKGYSGLSDMAVPSWILCAALVKKGGYLAIVLPETWLNREYAAPIQYLLLMNFDIIVIVKDKDTSWFDDALVRTCLLVARKKDIVSIADGKKKKTYIVKLGSGLAGDISLVEHLTYQGYCGYGALKQLMLSHLIFHTDEISSEYINTYTMFTDLFRNAFVQKLHKNQESFEITDFELLSQEMQRLFERHYEGKFFSVEQMGIKCGQGLRTGANEFFYGAIIGEDQENIVLQPRSWYEGKLVLPKRNIIRTLQNRRENAGVCVERDHLRTGLLYFQKDIRKSDYKKLSKRYTEQYSILPDNVERYITFGEELRLPGGKVFCELSSVKTNVRKDELGFSRFWYMLPELKDRHMPELCISRVAGGIPECLFVRQGEDKIAVDANFITIWGMENQQALQMLALFNSIWFQCNMELAGTVMGGGALKIEASHLRKILFPEYTQEQAENLSRCGNQICEENGINQKLREEIDLLSLSAFADSEDMYRKMRVLLKQKLSERGVNYDKQG